MFLQSLPLPSIKTVALAFLNDMIYRKKMLDGEKDIELRPYRTGDAARHKHYTHVIFRMVKRLRERKSLCKAGAHKNIIAKLGKTLGPYYNANDVLDAAESAGRKIGMTKDELIKYMTGWRKVDGGPKNGGYLVRVVRPMVLHELSDVRETNEFCVNDCSHNQSGFLPNSFEDKTSCLRVTHFDYIDDAEAERESSDCFVESGCVGGAAATAVALIVPLALPVDTVVPCSTMFVASQSKPRRATIFNGRFRLGQPTRTATATAVV
jgi:hypothetical protein